MSAEPPKRSIQSIPASYLYPRIIEFVTSPLKTSTGKIRRSALRRKGM